jgi:hypothetical protein
MHPRFVALTALALCATLVGTAGADPPDGATPAPAAAQRITTQISNAVLEAIGSAGELVQRELLRVQGTAHGEVTYFRRFDLQVRTGSNAYRNVRLHQGTVIDPRGTSLAAGQTVTVTGVPQSDGTLDANQITVSQ